MKRAPFEIMGWMGVFLILIAFISLNFEWLLPRALPYLMLNIAGSALVAIDAYQQRNYQPVFLNIVWLLVATYTLLRGFIS